VIAATMLSGAILAAAGVPPSISGVSIAGATLLGAGGIAASRLSDGH
jgi:hypothetical protein